MNIDKAIEIKQHYQYILLEELLPELIEADNLSIEALKWINQWKGVNSPLANITLPGETKE